MYLEEAVHITEDNFKKVFKYYKANIPKPSLADVIRIEKENKLLVTVHPDQFNDERTQSLGLHPLQCWDGFKLITHPGLILIRNPFTSLGQRYWIRRCLQDYTRKPNKRNIDIETDTADWWAECFRSESCNRQWQKKLRWTTLGYHHDWDTKVYRENNKSEFPPDLVELCDVVATYLGYSRFSAEAAIVNYYHMDSTLSAHTDHSEVNLVAPLFSFSFGQSAIFLIGGTQRSTEPSAILLNSGDILVMSQEARLCYHAVPKIIPALVRPWDLDNNNHHTDSTNIVNKFKYIKHHDEMNVAMSRNKDQTEWSVFEDYITESRINVNVRQVLHDNQTSLSVC